MIALTPSWKATVPRLRGALTLLSTAALLCACVVQERVYRPPPPAPPPRVVYTPPPAVALATPGGEVEVSANVPPPPLPAYEQPPCPEEGYLWTPGYWYWNGSDYYWVPGTWVEPPRVGFLWTPGYWAFAGGAYGWHVGYWGPHVGFYGGVNYGFGYGGVGFVGGRWAGNTFAYNRAVLNVNTTVIHNTYNETVVNNVTVNRVSFNGGAGGTAAIPSPQERAAAQEPHVAPTAVQHMHVQQAVRNPALAARANGGRPSIAATPRPAAFTTPGVVAAHGGAPLAPASTAAIRPRATSHFPAPSPLRPAVAKPASRPPPARHVPAKPAPQKRQEPERR